MPDSEAQCCGNCRYAENRHKGPEAEAAAAAAGHPLPPLSCRRFPQPYPHRPEDWCGEWYAIRGAS